MLQPQDERRRGRAGGGPPSTGPSGGDTAPGAPLLPPGGNGPVLEDARARGWAQDPPSSTPCLQSSGLTRVSVRHRRGSTAAAL